MGSSHPRVPSVPACPGEDPPAADQLLATQPLWVVLARVDDKRPDLPVAKRRPHSTNPLSKTHQTTTYSDTVQTLTYSVSTQTLSFWPQL